MNRIIFCGLVLWLLGVAAVPVGAGTWNVSSVIQLENAVRGSNPGDEIVVEPGTYYIQAELQMRTANVTLRGATGNREDVVFVGAGMNTDAGPRNIIHVVNDDITIEALTVSECWWNGIQLHGENNVDRTVIRNVKVLNIGERHVKGSKGSIYNAMRDVLIEDCLFQQTKARLPRPGHSVDPYDYIGGIDAMVAKDWIIRDNVFDGIKGSRGGGRGAIFIWQGVENPTVERNVIVDCDRGICFGNSYNPIDDHQVTGGIIRNNFVTQGASQAIELDHTSGVTVANNTFYSPNASYSKTVQVFDNGGGTTTADLEIVNNIIRGGVFDRAAGTWSVASLQAAGNIVDNYGGVVNLSWFVDAYGGDLHLTPNALAAIDAATVLADVPEDIDGHLRGLYPDMGADEIPEPATIALLAIGAAILTRRRTAP
ncbi:MAG: right-handed parallel beta-helix repeat-containing protein [Planctomycetota bacterium]